jgi:hypothetical protein
MTKTQQLASIIGLLASGLAINASAGIQYTPWQTFGDATLHQTSSAGDTTVTVDQYNPADWGGYDLHNVMIELDANGYVTYSVTDLSNADNTYDLQVNINVAISGAGVGELVVSIPQIVNTNITVLAGETVTSPGYPSDFLNGLTGSDSQTAHLVASSLTPAIVALFTGTGTVDLGAAGRQDNNSSSTGDVTQTVLSRYDFSGRIQYSYNVPTETPEPSTVLLFGAGLAGVGAALRRRRKVA